MGTTNLVRQVVVMDGCSRRPKRPSTRIFARCVRISGVSVFFRLNTFDLTMFLLRVYTKVRLPTDLNAFPNNTELNSAITV